MFGSLRICGMIIVVFVLRGICADVWIGVVVLALRWFVAGIIYCSESL